MKIEEALKMIDDDALFALCELYDNKEGTYPEHPFEGAAVYRFFRNLYAKETEKKSGFVRYIEENGTSGTLRELFYNYFIPHLGRLSEDNSVCKKEIEEGISLFFRMNRKQRR